MNALTPKEVADLRLWRPGEPGLIHVPFRLWQRILDALDGAPASAVEAAPESSEGGGGGAPAAGEREALYEALTAVPMLCLERHHGPGPYNHSSCLMTPDYAAMTDAALAALRAPAPPTPHES